MGIEGFNTATDAATGELDELDMSEFADSKLPILQSDGNGEQVDTEALIKHFDGVIDGKPENLPDASEDYATDIAIDEEAGVIRICRPFLTVGTDGDGTAQEYTQTNNSNFYGVRDSNPAQGHVSGYYYNKSAHEWRRYHTSTRLWIHANPQDILSTTILSDNIHWLGEHLDRQAFYNAITDYNSAHGYYAYIISEDIIVELDTGETFTEHMTPTTTWRWVVIGMTSIPDRVAALERNLSAHWKLTLPSFTITGNDTETRAFDAGLLKQFLDTIDNGAAELILEPKAVYTSGLTGDVEFKLIYDGSNSETDSQSLAGTEVESDPLTRKITSLDNDDDIKIEVTTTSLSDTSEDIEIQDVVLDVIVFVETPKATTSEIQDADEDEVRAYAPDQLPEILRQHQTFQWRYEDDEVQYFDFFQASDAVASADLQISKRTISNTDHIAVFSTSTADISPLENLRARDLVGIYDSNDNIIALLRVRGVWTDNGLPVDTLWADLDDHHYGDTNTHVTLRLSHIPIETHDIGEESSSNTEGQAVIDDGDGGLVLYDILAHAMFDEIWKAGTSDTDYSERVTANSDSTVYSLHTGKSFADYEVIIFWVENGTGSEAGFWVVHKATWIDVSSGVGTDTEGAITYWADNNHVSLRYGAITGFYKVGGNMGIRACWGLRSNDSV